jgi:hypothetical protein
LIEVSSGIALKRSASSLPTCLTGATPKNDLSQGAVPAASLFKLILCG